MLLMVNITAHVYRRQWKTHAAKACTRCLAMAPASPKCCSPWLDEQIVGVTEFAISGGAKAKSKVGYAKSQSRITDRAACPELTVAPREVSPGHRPAKLEELKIPVLPWTRHRWKAFFRNLHTWAIFDRSAAAHAMTLGYRNRWRNHRLIEYSRASALYVINSEPLITVWAGKLHP